MPLIQMLTITEQIEMSAKFKQFIQTQPQLYNIPLLTVPPWRVYVQPHIHGRWKKKDFHRYTDAFNFFKLNRHKYYDMSITCRRQQFEPPGRIVRITVNGNPKMVRLPNGKSRQETRLVPIATPNGHNWCMYCRRFTTFNYYVRHHAFSGDKALLFDPAILRCAICGIRQETGAYRP